MCIFPKTFIATLFENRVLHGASFSKSSSTDCFEQVFGLKTISSKFDEAEASFQMSRVLDPLGNDRTKSDSPGGSLTEAISCRF